MAAVEPLSESIVIAGGAGMLGRLLAPWLAAHAWQVHILSRRPLPSADPRIQFHPWDGQTLGSWSGLLEGSHALINLAGRSVNCRYTKRNRAAILASRIRSTEILAEAIARCARPPKIWLNSSTATIYRHTFGPAWTESGEIAATPAAKDAFSIEVARAWEAAFFTPTLPATRRVALRTAIVLARDPENVLTILLRLARLGLGGRMGDGRQWVSWIHGQDFCRAIEFLITPGPGESLAGPVNLAAPNPVPNAELMRVIRKIARRPFGLPAPRPLLELGALFLRTETELILKSRRVSPAKLNAADFQFLYPELQTAVEQLRGG